MVDSVCKDGYCALHVDSRRPHLFNCLGGVLEVPMGFEASGCGLKSTTGKVRMPHTGLAVSSRLNPHDA